MPALVAVLEEGSTAAAELAAAVLGHMGAHSHASQDAARDAGALPALARLLVECAATAAAEQVRLNPSSNPTLGYYPYPSQAGGVAASA